MTDAYRDLNHTGQLDPYKNPALSINERIDDLLARMTLEEKAGMMFQTMIVMGEDGKCDPDRVAFGTMGMARSGENRLRL